MSRKITVNVTQENIDKAVAGKDEGNPYLCPVGRALGDLGFPNYAVYGSTIRFRNAGPGERISGHAYVSIPDYVATQVERFDKTGKFEPISFEIELPDEVRVPVALLGKVRVEVTEDDIKNGKPRTDECPLALAVNRATGHRSAVYRIAALMNADDNFIATADLPPEAVEFHRTFDRHRPVYPFCFELEFTPKEN